MASAAYRILVVEDDSSVREAIAEFLVKNGFIVHEAASAQEGRQAIEEQQFDLVILDVMMPGEDGLSLCRDLAGIGPPVIIVSALSSTTARIVGLDTGASDYLPKPFDPLELLARVRALTRRTTDHGKPRILVFSGLQFDPLSALLRNCDDECIALTAGELRLLKVFLERPGRLLTRDALLDLTQSGVDEPFARAVDLAVSRLRRKLRAGGAENVIETVRGVGYRFQSRVETR